MPIKIVHCGDLHIGAEMSSLGRLASQRRAEVLHTLYRICEYCRTEEAEALLIAGDLFDCNSIEPSVRDTVKQYFEAIPHTQIFIVPGNHDYLCAGSVLDFDFGENVHLFREAGVIELKNARIYGIPFLSPYSDGFTLPRAEADGKINILLMHADTNGGNYNPVTSAALGATGMDYIALGHVHAASGILSADAVSFAYCGCPEPLGFDETGEKGVYAGVVDKHLVSLRFVKMCSREYKEITVDCADADNTDSLLSAARAALCGNEEHLIKLIFTGECDLQIDTEYIKTALEKEVYHLRVRNRTHPRVNLELLRQEQTLRGIFTDKMLRHYDGSEDKDTVMQALYAGLAAFDGREVGYSEN